MFLFYHLFLFCFFYTIIIHKIIQGEVTVEMALGAKHYLAKPPETGEVLGNSVFTRKKKYVFDFDGDSGNRVFFCCRKVDKT
jgi:hypothetical protein